LAEKRLSMKQDEIIVYYSPVNLRHPEANWDILSYEPLQVFDQVKENYSKEKMSFIGCPAVKNLLKNTFAWKNTLRSEYQIKDGNVEIVSKQGIAGFIDHQPTIKDNVLLIIMQSFALFCEEDSLEVELTAPYFEKAQHLQYGAVVPGRFDIAKWYRPINIEFNLWANQNYFSLDEDETMAYLSFKTDKQVKLVRYQMTEELVKIQRVVSDSATWNPKVPLSNRYQRFKRSRMKDIVLKEIKKNVV